MKAIFLLLKYFFKKFNFVLKIIVILHPHSELE